MMSFVVVVVLDVSFAIDMTRRAMVSGVSAMSVYDVCPKEKYCASTVDDASNGGRNFIEPWTYEDSSYQKAVDRLVAVLGTDIINVDDRLVTARRPGLWGNDYIEFYCTPQDITIQIRLVADSPLPAERLDKLRIAAGFDKLDVLRNRRRAFAVFTSPFDTFGPSLLDEQDPSSFDLRDADPLAPSFEPPDKNTRAWIRESRKAEF